MGVSFTIGRRNRNGNSPGGRIFLALFCSLFFFAGAFFFYLIVRDVSLTAETYLWETVPLNDYHAEVSRAPRKSHDEDPYFIIADYTYDLDGRSYSSRNISRKELRFSDYESARDALGDTVSDSSPTALVNPSNHGESIIVRGSMMIGLFIFIPLVFMLLGGGGVYAAIFLWSDETKEKKSISAGIKKQSDSRWLVRVGGLIVLVVGLLLSQVTALQLFRHYMTMTWTRVDATVISSDLRRVESDSEEGGTTVSWYPDILYTYSHDGKIHKASRFSYLGKSFKDRRTAELIADSCPPGATISAWIDSDNPAEAVLRQGETHWTDPFYLLPLVAVILGLHLLFFKRSATAEGSVSKGNEYRREPAPSSVSNRVESSGVSKFTSSSKLDPMTGYFVFEPKFERKFKFIGILLCALFWNGMLAIPLFGGAIGGFFSLLFFTFPILVGFGLFFLAIHQGLAVFNPTVILKLKNKEIALGEKLEVLWEVNGDVSKLDNLTIHLKGNENATYQRGTDTHTVRSLFTEILIAEEGRGMVGRSGRGMITVPVDTMHTFTSRNNTIVWSIEVSCAIRRWPDISDSYTITVNPLPMS